MPDLLTRRPFSALEDEMDRIFRRFFGRTVAPTTADGLWHPPVDIHLKEDSVIVRIDIPGGVNPFINSM